MKKLVSSLLASISLFLISAAAWADNLPTDFTDNTAMNTHHDLSVTYLSQVFGTVGNVLHGMSGQMLGHLFYRLNEGIIVVAGMWLVYTVFTIVLRAAQDGSFMGPNKNVALVFLKIAFGFSLLVPNPATGYSLLQDVVMKVVVEGVGLADQTWEYGLTYINNGGSLWRRPETNGAGKDIISQSTVNSVLGGNSQNKEGPGQKIFASAVCMYSSDDNQSPLKSNNNNIGPAVNGGPTVKYTYDVITDDSAHQFEFPGSGDTPPFKPGDDSCGAVTWDINNACTGAGSNSTKCTMAKEAVSELVTSLLPAAKKYYCSQHSSSDLCLGVTHNDAFAENETSFFGALLNYVNTIVPLVQFNSGKSADEAKRFIDEAQNEGWLSAGRYYWDLSQIQSHYDNVSNVDSYYPRTVDPTVNGNPEDDYQAALKQSLGYIYGAIDTANPHPIPVKGSVLYQLAQYAQSQHSGDTGGGEENWGHGGLDAGIALIGGIFSETIYDIYKLIHTFTTGSDGAMGPDPILFLHKIGIRAISVAADIWFGFLGIMAIALFATGACTATYNAQTPVQALLGWIKPLLMVVAVGLWGTGFVLAYYVPLYPYMLYTFGVIGWIIVVIEAMVAAPLIAFGLTHPEGHDFLGEAKQGGMLLLGVFLRPVLMVVGLIAGMILSYVALRIVVYTFSGLAVDLFANTPSSGPASGSILHAATALMSNSMATAGSVTGAIVSLMVFPLVLIIFTMLVYVVTTQSFSLIFALPDNVMRWIGIPGQRSEYDRMATQLESKVGGFASSTGRSGGLQASERIGKGAANANLGKQLHLGPSKK
ncbi:type IV secretion protein DotA [Coxiella burnetii]|uniref:DotA n=1 Tax=Coxiella burnetii (strain Dugway 5J108-111) TaxID=434922 RepID=A9KDJ8_COXBN|nr:type IVB secretion system protein DotA [Coxiella burnetii]ABS78182.2 DotA [Coxiella burnetii Dugway 5J108-111]OYK80919.1 type IV secretion protein DotA [Coxiella burnetii]OYK83007.1 type IV secretion protein DotA [Coxiella burnetii]